MYREFTVPDDEEIFSLIGEWPTMDENGTRTLTWRQSEGDSLILSYDPLSRSVRARWTSGNGDELLDVYREGATRLTASATPSATQLSVEFHMGECVGEMQIQVAPKFRIQDRLLYA
jgi:hypothetical protein